MSLSCCHVLNLSVPCYKCNFSQLLFCNSSLWQMYLIIPPNTSIKFASCFSGVSVPYYILYLIRSEEHTSELQSRPHLVCRLLLEKKKKIKYIYFVVAYAFNI